MFIIYVSLLLVLHEFNFLKTEISSQFTTMDCYESFSNATLFFTLFHNNPTGPLYLYVQFYSNILYLNKNKRFNNFGEHHFKKVSGGCKRSNIVFTSNTKKIRQMMVMIKIFLIPSEDDDNEISHIIYTFNYGFKPGVNLLIDMNQNFALKAEVSYTGKNNFIDAISDLIAAQLYLNSLINKKGNLCVVTKNNHPVIIKPDYGGYIPNGYIIGIEAIFNDKNSIDNEFELRAFECYSDETDEDQNIVFIHEKKSQILLDFNVISFKFDINGKTIKECPFSMKDTKLQHFSAHSSIPPNFKKIFLMENNRKSISCPGKRYILLHESSIGTVFYAQEYLKIEVKPEVLHSIWITHSTLTPCD